MDELAGPDPELEPRVGVLALRAWVDGPLPDGFRVRMTSRLDISSPDDVVTMAGDREAVISAVREWLETFLSS